MVLEVSVSMIVGKNKITYTVYTGKECFQVFSKISKVWRWQRGQVWTGHPPGVGGGRGGTMATFAAGGRKDRETERRDFPKKKKKKKARHRSSFFSRFVSSK